MTTTATADYWELLWAGGRRYGQPDGPETHLMDGHLGAGHGRPALDIGCGDGALARHLHHALGYRTTGIDFSPSALALAASQAGGAEQPGPLWRCVDIGAANLTALPEPAYAAITCRLVYRWLGDKGAFVHHVRAVATARICGVRHLGRLTGAGGAAW
ncbi:methyltransferase [Streptomyces sp. NPDC091268]|uniref:methyltransferase n=1 Tax=Streptomyces sp. NPDC091268 TaxID=3365979 RepID=UPI0038199EFC